LGKKGADEEISRTVKNCKYTPLEPSRPRPSCVPGCRRKKSWYAPRRGGNCCYGEVMIEKRGEPEIIRDEGERPLASTKKKVTHWEKISCWVFEKEKKWKKLHVGQKGSGAIVSCGPGGAQPREDTTRVGNEEKRRVHQAEKVSDPVVSNTTTQKRGEGQGTQQA